MQESELLLTGKEIILSHDSSSGIEITLLQGESAIYSKGIPRTDSSTVPSSEFTAGVLKKKKGKGITYKNYFECRQL